MKEKKRINLVWIKRDIRTQDHAALEAAEKANLPYLIIYLFEPSLLAYPDSSLRHQQFIYHSLIDANKKLKAFHRSIQSFYTEATTFFEFILKNFDLKSVFSYQESGIRVTWSRDQKVMNILKKNNISWYQFQKGGVIRGINNRINWDRMWLENFSTPPIKNVFTINDQPPLTNPFSLPKTMEQKFHKESAHFQSAGETQAWKYLKSFTNDRGKIYHKMISKPLDSRKSCGRISPYLSWGNLSVKQVMYHVSNHPNFEKHKRAFGGLMTRLKWRCHFIQKFEVECDYEILCINRGYESLIRTENKNHLQAWKTGHTGFPLVDASMRCLQITGWINFRMRAMLVSFLCHHLDQDWRSGIYHLAKLFLDYEPGIHISQVQMQSGVTGINLPRIYSVSKQSHDHDPNAIWIKNILPQLSEVDPSLIHASELNDLYIPKIIDLKSSAKDARERVWSIRKSKEFRKEAAVVYNKHGSRRKRNFRK